MLLQPSVNEIVIGCFANEGFARPRANPSLADCFVEYDYYDNVKLERAKSFLLELDNNEPAICHRFSSETILLRSSPFCCSNFGAKLAENRLLPLVANLTLSYYSASGARHWSTDGRMNGLRLTCAMHLSRYELC